MIIREVFMKLLLDSFGKLRIRLKEICKECCLFPVHGMFFCAPKVDIGKHLKPLRNDSELANFVKTAYDNGCKIELYVEHHGYNVLEGATKEVVDEELDDEIEMEDVSEYVGLDHVGEEDVEIPNTRLTDSFLKNYYHVLSIDCVQGTSMQISKRNGMGYTTNLCSGVLQHLH
ncbi:hypothetical protein Tco_0050125 [Tanacetum coccineum]